MYPYIVDKSTPPQDSEFYLDLNQTKVIKKPLQATTDEQEFNFPVPSSAFAFSFAIQERNAGTSTLFPPQKFTCQGNQERNLTRLEFSYNGRTYPPTNTNFQYNGNTDYMAKLYADYLSDVEMDTEGFIGETYEEWLEMGPVHHFRVYKEASRTSTQFTVKVTFGSGAPTNANLLIFPHYSTVTDIQSRGGQNEQVQTENA
jgi:hypothetical protein